MPPDLIDLAQRANTATEHLSYFRHIESQWRPGMRTAAGFRLMNRHTEQPALLHNEGGTGVECVEGGWRVADLPQSRLHVLDLSDPITVYTLLLIVQEASGDPDAFLRPVRRDKANRATLWECAWTGKTGCRCSQVAETREEAVVKALEVLAREV